MTYQPPMGGGEGAAHTPFAILLASLVTCAGIYVLGFCKQRVLDTKGIRLIQRLQSNPFTELVGNVEIEIQVPPEFPEKYHNALIRSAEQCAVKKHMEQPPQFNVLTTVVG